MKSVYAIHKFNHTHGRTEGFIGLYATKELAEKQLRALREEVERGAWGGNARMTIWHDETDTDVTYMTVKRDCKRGPEVASYAVEEIPVYGTED